MKDYDRIFRFRGKPTVLSFEEVRAMLQACFAVFCYHNAPNQLAPIAVVFKKVVDHKDPSVIGCASGRRITLQKNLNSNSILSAIVHEMIHVFYTGNLNQEKITSTLTAKLRADVSVIANILVENTYRRAAYFAHAKISYKPKDGKDYYDQSQYRTPCEPSVAKYRKRKIK